MKPQRKVLPASNTVQNIEQRSIAIFSDIEGPQTLPARKIDISIYAKTEDEKIQLNKLKSGFDLRAWNERNRPGNNKN